MEVADNSVIEKKAGQPTKYKAIEELPQNDGRVYFSGKLENIEFLNEKALQAHIEDDLENICKLAFDDELIRFSSEYDFGVKPGFYPRSKRIDIIAECKKYTYLIELKRPKYKVDNRNAIGQILDYGLRFSDPKKQLIIISTLFDEDTAIIIKSYQLPIRYFYIDKQRIMEFEGISHD